MVWDSVWPGFPDSSVGKESSCNAGDPSLIPGKICWRRDKLPTPVFLDFPCGSADKESACNVGDVGSIPGLGRFPGVEHGTSLQYSCLESPMDRGAWQATEICKESDTTKHTHNSNSNEVIVEIQD